MTTAPRKAPAAGRSENAANPPRKAPAAVGGMGFMLRFMLWASAAFVIAWFVHRDWQKAIGSIGARLAAPPGAEIEIMDIELYFPFDLGVYVALCLASAWTPFARRGRAIALGAPVIIAVEIAALVAAIKVMIAAADPEAAQRFVDGVIRVAGLVAASAVWMFLLGRERLSLAARRWLGT